MAFSPNELSITEFQQQQDNDVRLMANLRARDIRAGGNDNDEDTQFGIKANSLRDKFNTESRKLSEAIREKFSLPADSEQLMALQTLGNIDFQTDADGGLIVRSGSGNGNEYRVSENGGVGAPELCALSGSDPRFLTGALDMAVLAKASIGDGPTGKGICINGRGDELREMVLAKAVELSGGKCGNPPETSLDEAHPELAARMEQEWEQMQQNNNTPSLEDNIPDMSSRQTANLAVPGMGG